MRMENRKSQRESVAQGAAVILSKRESRKSRLELGDVQAGNQLLTSYFNTFCTTRVPFLVRVELSTRAGWTFSAYVKQAMTSTNGGGTMWLEWNVVRKKRDTEPVNHRG